MYTPLIIVAVVSSVVGAIPPQSIFTGPRSNRNSNFFDIQAHRGGRANTIENTLPSFAWGLIEGATTLELDNGITKDGVVIIWHDQEVTPSKCRDTAPAFSDDPDFPYVGKLIANLTWSQIMTLDCSTRQINFPGQLTYPGTRIPSLSELFDFLDCADPEHNILLNIESKSNAAFPGRTLDFRTFVHKQYELFSRSAYYRSITELDPTIVTSALIDDYTLMVPEGERVSPWFAGIDINTYNGSNLGERIAEAAYDIHADILSPIATSELSPVADPGQPGYSAFTTKAMVSRAHELGLVVKPWTVNRLNVIEEMVEMGVDGIITDYPDVLRRWAQQHKLPVAPRYPKYNVLTCLNRFIS
ncbi:hypothetical protein Clacol_003729 [Clathrus columnatus]|uniref:GP-PDE domain-containing protein n=1 Tax=Clathrus columnatus TaxID=1419009 RepID=A0AAV5A906_9AGAM|nr:hypothetical protein Clacol_003729 [Clathrus columnatus]